MLEGAGTEGGSVHGPNASSTVAAGQQFVYHLLFVIPLSLLPLLNENHMRWKKGDQRWELALVL